MTSKWCHNVKMISEWRKSDISMTKIRSKISLNDVIFTSLWYHFGILTSFWCHFDIIFRAEYWTKLMFPFVSKHTTWSNNIQWKESAMRNLIRNVHNSFDQKWGDDFGCYAMINLLFLQHGFLFSSAFDPICDSCIIKSVRAPEICGQKW